MIELLANRKVPGGQPIVGQIIKFENFLCGTSNNVI